MKKFSLFLIKCIFKEILNWLTVCGIIKLGTLCFDWKFHWNIATIIWGILFVRDIIKNIKNKLNIKRS